jgi:hypothetical protein
MTIATLADVRALIENVCRNLVAFRRSVSAMTHDCGYENTPLTRLNA